jgi:hypothetical protein
LEKQLSVFTPGDIKQFKMRFAHLDLNATGALDRTETELLIGSLVNAGLSQETLRKMIHETDLQGDGLMQFDEFCALMLKIRAELEKRKAQAVKAEKNAARDEIKKQRKKQEGSEVSSWDDAFASIDYSDGDMIELEAPHASGRPLTAGEGEDNAFLAREFSGLYTNRDAFGHLRPYSEHQMHRIQSWYKDKVYLLTNWIFKKKVHGFVQHHAHNPYCMCGCNSPEELSMGDDNDI